LIGRLFRSDGESVQKRNLLIFVTANLVNPSGAVKSRVSAATPSAAAHEEPPLAVPASSPERSN